MVEFPEDFFWGTATSAHQVEGNNKRNDWWRWEQSGGGKEPSGKACDHYNRYEEDFDLIDELGHNAYRFSVEWSRIEPEEGNFNQEAIFHYQDYIEALKKRDIEPFVTLHHFTNPVWFSDRGGWAKEENLDYFYRFVGKISSELDAKYWFTINEPAVYTYSYLTNIWPTGGPSIRNCFNTGGNFLKAHAKAREILKDEDPDRMVSLAKSIMPCESSNFFYDGSAKVVDFFYNDIFLESLKEGRLISLFGSDQLEGESPHLDFIGINYYTRILFSTKLVTSYLPVIFGLKTPFEASKDFAKKRGVESSLMGMEVYPKGIRKAIEKATKLGVPIIISENGICAKKDGQRQRFIKSHLAEVAKALKEGADIRGYFYWSLIDNFEWQEGYYPRFGLVEVDYETQERRVRKSAKLYRQIIEGEVKV